MSTSTSAISRRRLVALFGTAAGSSVFAAACQTGGQAPGAPGAPAGGGKASIRWQFRGSDADLKAAQDFVATSFAKTHPNIELTIEPAPDQRDEKLVTAMAGGNAPDVFESWTDNVTQYADRGQVLGTPYR